MNLSRIFKVQYGINTHRPIDHEYLWRGANVETCFLPSCKRSTLEMADAIDSQDLSTAKSRLFSGSQEWIKKASIKSDSLADTNDRKWTSLFDLNSNEILMSLCFWRNFPFLFSDQKSEVSTFRRHFPVDLFVSPRPECGSYSQPSDVSGGALSWSLWYWIEWLTDDRRYTLTI